MSNKQWKERVWMKMNQWTIYLLILLLFDTLLRKTDLTHPHKQHYVGLARIPMNTLNFPPIITQTPKWFSFQEFLCIYFHLFQCTSHCSFDSNHWDWKWLSLLIQFHFVKTEQTELIIIFSPNAMHTVDSEITISKMNKK